MTKAPAQPNQSLLDGLTVLQAVAVADGPVGSRALAAELGLEPTRVNRLLKTLASTGVLAQTTRGKYRPGPGMHVLAAQAMYGSRLLSVAAEPLATLATPALTVGLGVLWRGSVAYLYHAPPGVRPTAAVGRVALFPAERSGIGVALMAQHTASRKPDVRAARRAGYALARVFPDETADPPTRSLGLALRPSLEAAITVSGRFTDEQIPDLLARLRTAADAIHTALEDPA